MLLRASVVILGALVALPSGARAQERRVLTIEVEDLVEGELVRPEGEMLSVRPSGRRAGDAARELARIEERARSRGWSPELRIRAAQLLVQRSDARLTRAMMSEDRRGASEELEGLRSDRERDLRAAIEHLRGALAERGAPDTRESAQASLLLMHLSAELGDHAGAQSAARALIEGCPSCPAAADAHVYLGERAFEAADLTLAMRHYEAAIGVARAAPGLRAYAHYKLAWVHFNLGAFEAAFVAFQAARAGASQAALRREAARDSLLVLARMPRTAGQRARIIADLADTSAEANRLEERFEETLRELGLDREADELRLAWLARIGPL